MWRLASEAQEHLDASNDLVRDAALEAYVLEVARRLQPPAVIAATPFRVLKNRVPNAFCFPNGAIYLHTGILARMESEAELAVLLAHEMTHATHRHALRHLRSSNRSGAAFATLGAVVGAGAHGAGGLQMLAASGHGRDLEREADAQGLARVAAAGYHLADAGKMFERLRDWSTDEGIKESPAFYASHPRIQERIDTWHELAEAVGAGGGVRNADVYAERTADVLLLNARLDAAAGRHARARADVERYRALRPHDAAAAVLHGEVVRRQAAAGFEEVALASYRRAIDVDPGQPEAWRGLGLVLQRKGADGEARGAFRRYLELAPEASDAAHVRALLDAPLGGTR